MTSLTNEGRLTGTGFAPLPRVNLLPPEIAERRRFRQTQYGLGGVIAGAVGIVVLLYLAAAHSVTAAQSDLTASTDTNARLTGQVAQYRNVTALYDQAAAAQGMLVQAMGEEIRYSHLLSDLSLSIPDNVWLTNLSYTQGPVPPVAGSSVGGVGTFTASATGFSHDDVAVWLDSLAAQPNYVSPDFSASTEGLLGTRRTVTFTTSAAVADSAYSRRYTTPIGG